MDDQPKIPTVEEIKTFLGDYGWNFRETKSDDGKDVIISPYTLENDTRGILVSFRIEGEFVIASTVGFLKSVPNEYSQDFLHISDRIKLVKLFAVDLDLPDVFDAEVGFELWDASWNKETFFSFMDMLCLGVEKVLDKVTKDNVPHETSFVTYS